MEGDTFNWTEWINSDAGSDAQPWGYDGHQADLGAERLELGTRGSLFGPLSLDQSWPLNDSIVPTHPFTRWPSPSMLSFKNLNGQQHVQQTSLSESAIYVEPVPQPYDGHNSFINGAVLEDTAGIEQPLIESCLARHEGEEENSDQPYLDPIQKCSCMNCVFLDKDSSGYRLKCRVPGCQEQNIHWYPYYTGSRHERTHFGKAGDYHCLEEGCKTSTKKWADLRRHCLNRHCTNATRFPCPVLGCKYGGDNGFTRKDKLKSHHRNVHQGNVVPGKAFQPIKPKVNGTEVIKGKPQGIQTITPEPSVEA